MPSLAHTWVRHRRGPSFSRCAMDCCPTCGQKIRWKQCTCIICGGTFYKLAGRVRRFGSRYCSRQCAGVAKRSTPAVFWAKVDRRTPDECWPWTGKVNENGYGGTSFGGRHVLAHRLAYTLAVGPIPEGLGLMHSCDNPPCCNPAHLKPGTCMENVRDCIQKGRKFIKLTDRQVEAVRNDRRPARVIATDHNMSKSYMYSIKNRSARDRKLLK